MTQMELSRRERKKEETKERIFKAALKLFRSKGFEETTIDEITERADVAKGTFFNYFPRKESVFAYLSETWVEEAEEKVEALMAGSPRPDMGRQVIEVFIDFAAFYEEDRALSKWMVMEWHRRAQTGCDELCRRWDALGERVVAFLQRIGQVRADVPARAAAEMFASVHEGTVMKWLSAEKPPFALRDELRKRLSLMLEGLGPGKS